MQFRTEIELPGQLASLSQQQRGLAMGSCFADRMGERLALARFPLQINPLGISYHPLALARLLHLITQQQTPEPQYAPHLEAWHSFDLHSRFNQPSRSEFLIAVEEAIQQTHDWLMQCDYLLVTFGTAWAYRHQAQQQLVNNNHRYPARTFTRELLYPDQIVNTWQACIHELRSWRPHLQVLLTVSPVRHTRDTLVGNQLSKATLRLACHQLCEALPHVQYFPAYEIMLDDLRDYRFYTDDLIHPSAFAEQYIWEKFTQCCLSAPAREVLARWEAVQRDLNHRPRQTHGQAYRRFLRQLQHKLNTLAPQLDVAEEQRQVQRLLDSLPDASDA